MNKTLQIPFTLRGIENRIEVIYKANDSASESGFDALNVPFDPDFCLGYPVMNAYVKDMVNTGYRRYCGWIQLVLREYFSSDELTEPDEINLSLDRGDPAIIYFAHGYPAEIYDAPCFNLNGKVKGKWTAYTYLVDKPTRMNGNKMIFLAGFQWGYKEAMVDGKLTVEMQDIKEIDHKQWEKHIPCMKEAHPQYEYV